MNRKYIKIEKEDLLFLYDHILFEYNEWDEADRMDRIKEKYKKRLKS